MKIYINPGHGGTDSGAVGIGGRQEKDDTLRYASAVTDKLSTAGHEVKLERDGDYYISVTDIAKKANAWGADLFIAFHRNSGGGTGAECLVVSSASEVSHRMAQAIQNALVEVGFRDRGVKVQDKNTYVLSHTTMPSTTIECGFVDSQADNELFDGRFDDVVYGIANAILSIAGGSIEPEPQPMPEPEPNDFEIKNFVNRLYVNVLDREPDQEGYWNWVKALMARAVTPKEAAYGICFSNEELLKREATDEFVDELYRGLLGRKMDAAARDTWIGGLYKNLSREDVFNGITDSEEFKAIEKQMGF